MDKNKAELIADKIMEDNGFVPVFIKVKATAELQKEIEAELKEGEVEEDVDVEDL